MLLKGSFYGMVKEAAYSEGRGGKEGVVKEGTKVGVGERNS
jgi:hypothetical protein